MAPLVPGIPGIGTNGSKHWNGNRNYSVKWHRHLSFQVEHGRSAQILLTGQFVGRLSLLGFDLCEVGSTLAPHLDQHLCLSQQQVCLTLFLLSHRDRPLVVQGVDPGLQGGDGRLVLLLSQGVAPHEHTRLGSLQGVHSAEAVEHRQRGIHAVVVIEGAHIGIAVGLRVDGASEVVLGSDAGIH